MGSLVTYRECVKAQATTNDQRRFECQDEQQQYDIKFDKYLLEQKNIQM